MIQRIQTVYLVLGALALSIPFFLSALWQAPPAEAYAWFVPAAGILAGVLILSAIGAVFLYNDRPQQRKVVLAIQLATVVLLLVLYGAFFFTGALDVRTPTGGVDWGRLAVLVLPVLAYVFFFLARRGIEKDIELVRSMDRLR